MSTQRGNVLGLVDTQHFGGGGATYQGWNNGCIESRLHRNLQKCGQIHQHMFQCGQQHVGLCGGDRSHRQTRTPRMTREIPLQDASVAVQLPSDYLLHNLSRQGRWFGMYQCNPQ